ncbi:hypothetical protein [Archangium gephyra]|nr:hypothetical protein [Archangium gephyra]
MMLKWNGKLLWLSVLLAGCGGMVEGMEETQAAGNVEQAWTGQEEPGARSGATRWTQRLTGPSEELPGGVAHDKDGNVLIAASFSGSLSEARGTLGTAPVTERVSASVVAKYLPDGARVWARTFPVVVTAITTKPDRHVLLAGNVTGTVDLGGGPLSLGEFPTGLFLLELDAKGRHVWSRVFPLEFTSFINANGLATDRSGNIALAATLRGAVFLGSRTATADSSVVLIRFDARGTAQWVFEELQFGTSGGVAVDSDGNLYLAGTLITDLFEPRDFIPFVSRFSPSGTRLWRRQLETTFGEANAIGVHGNRVVVTGSFREPLTFEGRTFVPEGGQEGFLLALTRDGDERWVRHFGVEGLDLAMDHRDDVVVVGRYENGNDLGRGPLAGVAGSDHNLFVAKFDRVDGRPRWTRGFAMAHPEGQSTSAGSYHVSVDEQGSSVFLGDLIAPMDVGPVTLRPSGSRDLFLLDSRP